MAIDAVFNIVGKSGPGIAIATAGLILLVAIGGTAIVPGLIKQVERFVWGFLAVGLMLSLLWAAKYVR